MAPSGQGQFSRSCPVQPPRITAGAVRVRWSGFCCREISGSTSPHCPVLPSTLCRRVEQRSGPLGAEQRMNPCRESPAGRFVLGKRVAESLLLAIPRHGCRTPPLIPPPLADSKYSRVAAVSGLMMGHSRRAMKGILSGRAAPLTSTKPDAAKDLPYMAQEAARLMVSRFSALARPSLECFDHGAVSLEGSGGVDSVWHIVPAYWDARRQKAVVPNGGRAGPPRAASEPPGLVGQMNRLDYTIMASVLVIHANVALFSNGCPISRGSTADTCPGRWLADGKFPLRRRCRSWRLRPRAPQLGDAALVRRGARSTPSRMKATVAGYRYRPKIPLPRREQSEEPIPPRWWALIGHWAKFIFFFFFSFPACQSSMPSFGGDHNGLHQSSWSFRVFPWTAVGATIWVGVAIGSGILLTLSHQELSPSSATPGHELGRPFAIGLVGCGPRAMSRSVVARPSAFSTTAPAHSAEFPSLRFTGLIVWKASGPVLVDLRHGSLVREPGQPFSFSLGPSHSGFRRTDQLAGPSSDGSRGDFSTAHAPTKLGRAHVLSRRSF